MNTSSSILGKVRKGDYRSLAKCISAVENEEKGYEEILQSLEFQKKIPVIGITGPPGAGKSTLLNAMAEILSGRAQKIGILAIDPTSPFTHGSLLGDRVRMSAHFGNPNIFIRSLATRGSLGGLSAKTMEITDIMKQADFDIIFIETVGVGQSEVEIASLADTTILVLVPGAGDEVQVLKSGIMEIADIFVINKTDRGGADVLVKQIEEHLHLKKPEAWSPPVMKATASKGEGVEEILEKTTLHGTMKWKDKKAEYLAGQAFRLIRSRRMRDVSMQELIKNISALSDKQGFNLYRFVQDEAIKNSSGQ